MREVSTAERRVMLEHGYPAAALTIYQRPVGRTLSFVVECRCGWRSQHTTDWVRSLNGHMDREARRARTQVPGGA